MAQFTQTSDPNFVSDPNGRIVPTASVDPNDIAMSVDTSPLNVPPPAPVSSGPPTVDEALAKLDHPDVAPYVAPRGMQVSQVQVRRGTDTSAMQEGNLESATDLGEAYKTTAADKYKMQAGLAEKVMDKTAVDIADAAKAASQNAAKREAARKSELALRDQSDPALDPDQFMRENGLGMVILGAISGALGTLQANGGDGGAAFLKVLDSRIDRNIAAQKQQIESGRVRRGNLIDYYVKEGLDAKEAETAAKALYYAKSADYVQQNKDFANLADGPANADLMAKTLLAKAKESNNALALQGQDQVTENYARPVAKKADLAAAIKKQTDADEALEKNGQPPEVRRAAWAAAGTGLPFPTGKSEFQKKEDREGAKDEREASRRTDDEKKAQSAFDTIVQLGRKVGLKNNPDAPDSFTVPSGINSRINWAEAGEGLDSAVGGATPIANARAAAMQGLGRLASGGVIGKDELPEFKALLGEGKSPQQIASALNTILVFVRPRLKDFRTPSNGGTENPKDWE